MTRSPAGVRITVPGVKNGTAVVFRLFLLSFCAVFRIPAHGRYAAALRSPAGNGTHKLRCILRSPEPDPPKLARPVKHPSALHGSWHCYARQPLCRGFGTSRVSPKKFPDARALRRSASGTLPRPTTSHPEIACKLYRQRSLRQRPIVRIQVHLLENTVAEFSQVRRERRWTREDCFRIYDLLTFANHMF